MVHFMGEMASTYRFGESSRSGSSNGDPNHVPVRSYDFSSRGQAWYRPGFVAEGSAKSIWLTRTAARRCTMLLGPSTTSVLRILLPAGPFIRPHGPGPRRAPRQAKDELDGEGYHGVYTSLRARTYVYHLLTCDDRLGWSMGNADPKRPDEI